MSVACWGTGGRRAGRERAFSEAGPRGFIRSCKAHMCATMRLIAAISLKEASLRDEPFVHGTEAYYKAVARLWLYLCVRFHEDNWADLCVSALRPGRSSGDTDHVSDITSA